MNGDGSALIVAVLYILYYTILYLGMNIHKSQFCGRETMLAAVLFASAAPLAGLAAAWRLGAGQMLCIVLLLTLW